MIHKINTHRFEVFKNEIVTDVKTTGVDKATKDLNDMGNSLDSLGKKALNFNPSSITGGIEKITQFQKVLATLSKTKININDVIKGLSDTGMIEALPANMKQLVSSLGEMQSHMNTKDAKQNYVDIAGQLEVLKRVLMEVDETMKNTGSTMNNFSKGMETAAAKSANALQIAGQSFKQLTMSNVAPTESATYKVTASRTPTDIGTPNLSQAARDMDNFSTSSANASSVVSQLKGVIRQMNDSLKESPKLVDNLNKAFKGLDAVKLLYLYRTVKRTSTALINAVDSAAAYEESINLYKMALGEYSNEATAWANKIADKLLLDRSDIMQYTGAFFNLARGMGVTNDAAYLMSKNLTQLTYDMSSYLNISVAASQAKIQSAMAGQSRAVATVGIATQQASLQELAYSMGIEKSVSKMTQAEKTYLRYIQLLRSTTHMQGDLGKTMNTPANAIRILKTQVEMLGRAFGQVLMPMIQAVLPYVLAVTNVLKQAAEALAGFFGYKFTDVDTTTSSFSIIEDGLDNVADTADKAGKKVKNSLAPFDDLNVVMSSTAGSGKAGGGSEDVTSTLLKNLPSYDMLDKYTDTFKKKAEELEGVVKPFLAMAAAGVIYNALNKVWTFMKTKLFASALFSSVRTLAGLFKDDLAGGISGLGGALSESYSMWHSNLTAMDKIKNTIIGAAGIVIGFTMMSDSFKRINEEGLTLLSALEGLAGGMLTFGGTFLVVSSYIKTLSATLITTGIITILLELGAAIKSMWDLNKERNEFLAGFEKDHEYAGWYLEDFKQLGEKYKELTLAGANHHEKLFEELQKHVDENGKVKEGYEDRVKFILNDLKEAYGVEIKLEKDTIKNYKQKVDEIKKAIKAQKEEAKLQIYKEYYQKALEKEIELQEALTEANIDLATAEAKGNKQMVENNKRRIETLQNTYNHNKDIILSYEKILEGSMAENEKTVSEGMLDMEKSIAGLKKGTDVSLTDMFNTSRSIYDALVKNGKGSYDELKSASEDAYGTIMDYLRTQTKDVNNITPELKSAWFKLASESKIAYVETLAKMSPADQKKINDMLGTTSVDAIAYAKDYAKKHGGKIELDIKTKYDTNEIEYNAEQAAKKFQKGLTTAFKGFSINVDFTGTSGYSHGSGGVSKRASGGFPDKGELFLMNEAGPEFIGSIGGKTAVTNQDQMVKAVSNAISLGLQSNNSGSSQPQTIVVQIGNEKIYSGQVDYQNRQTDRYGTATVKI